jgi:hypothetical protein
MPHRKNEDKPEENKDELQIDQPSVDDPDGREAITHPQEAYDAPADTSYRPGDPPPSQSMFPPDHAKDPTPSPLEQPSRDQG